MRWPTVVCSRSGGGGCTPALSRPSKALYPDRLAEQVDRLAHHALRGEVWDKALAYCRQAGEKAFMALSPSRGRGLLRAGAGALAHLPESHDTHEQAIDLRLALRPALSASGLSSGLSTTCTRPRPWLRGCTITRGWRASLPR